MYTYITINKLRKGLKTGKVTKTLVRFIKKIMERHK
jgi:hypothetical protein